MKKIKVLKDFTNPLWIDFKKWQIWEVWETEWDIWFDKYLIERWFAEYTEEIKEEETPKFKIWDKVVEESKFNNIWLDEYIVITSIAIYNKRCVYNLQYWKDWYCNSLKENEIRLATPEEIQKYFN